jgi:hypothetical protein
MRILKDLKEKLMYIVHKDDIQISKEGDLYNSYGVKGDLYTIEEDNDCADLFCRACKEKDFSLYESLILDFSDIEDFEDAEYYAICDSYFVQYHLLKTFEQKHKEWVRQWREENEINEEVEAITYCDGNNHRSLRIGGDFADLEYIEEQKEMFLISLFSEIKNMKWENEGPGKKYFIEKGYRFTISAYSRDSFNIAIIEEL